MTIYLRVILFLLAVLAGGLAESAQAGWRVVTGKILGSDGKAVVGATVIARSGDAVVGGVPSGLDGRFVLKLAATRAETILLEVSSIGYAKYEKQLYLDRDSTTVMVKLKAVLVDVGGMEVRPVASVTVPRVELSKQAVAAEARASFLPSNPMAAVKAPQIIREGSAHSSRLRINGTSPIYFVNGIEIGRDPNHYGMFSIVPASLVDNITAQVQGTSALYDAPSAVEFETYKPFHAHAGGEVSLSAIETGGAWSVGGRRWFSEGAVRKSILDELVERFNVDSGRRTIPPTSFRDLFMSSGIRLGQSTHIILDQYHVSDALEYRTDGTSRNALGANTSLATSEHYVGARLEALRPGALLRLHTSIRRVKESYAAEPYQSTAAQVEPILDLHAAGTTVTGGAEAVLALGTVEMTVGNQIRYIAGQTVDLVQQNWNFLPPDAASDNPNIYQPELNVLYGEYHGKRRRTDHAAFVSVRWAAGPVQMETGVRGGHYGALENGEWLGVRQLVTLPLGDETQVSLFAGTFAEDPARRVLEAYQPIIHVDYNGLLPIRTVLVSAQYEHGGWAVSAFRKRITQMPVLTPDFDRVSASAAAEGFLRTRSTGQADFYGADVTARWDSLAGGRVQVEGSYGYTHATKTTSGVTVDYELNAPHRLRGALKYRASGVIRLGAEVAVRSGYAYTPLPSSADEYGEDRYSEAYYRASLRAENSARFPMHASLNLSVTFDFGETEVYGSVANVTNRANPIISAADGYVYDAGVLPSVGMTRRF